MKVRVNGTVREVENGSSLSDLLSSLGLRGGAVVEMNLEVIRPELFPSTRLSDGDLVEIVRFVGGG